jgi:ribosomal protein S18 acetylase RimI-like enzyme
VVDRQEAIKKAIKEAMRISPATAEDEDFLWLMLTYAASMDGGGPEQIEQARSDPYLRTYVHHWGRMAGDLGVIARHGSGRALGAAWLRLSHGGSTWRVADQATPELATAVLPQARCQGIGTAMMHELIRLAAQSYRQITLSVRRKNPALRFYKRLGFAELSTMKNRVGGDSIVMALELQQASQFHQPPVKQQ